MPEATITPIVQFTVYGTPQTKGSMKAIPKRNGTGFIMTSTNKGLPNWENAVASEAAKQADETLWQGPVRVHVAFYFSRPASHYGTGRNRHRIKDSAPRKPITKNKNDLDKLCRAILDALSGVVYEDDSQVTALVTSKHYALTRGAGAETEHYAPSHRECAVITVKRDG